MKQVPLGFTILVLAGVMNASFTLPMKYTRHWAWENTWLMWTVWALVILPFLLTAVTVPHAAAFYVSAPVGVLLRVALLGTGWGVAQVFFGLAVEAIGIALTFSLVLGTSAAVGTLVPLIRLHPERLRTAAGHDVLAGVALVIAGVLVCAIAGRTLDRVRNRTQATAKTSALGIALAILCGFGASFINLGLAFGAPLAEAARAAGVGVFSASNVVWLPLMLAGSIPNLLYCFWLLRKNHTAKQFGQRRLNYWLMAFAMAVLWLGSTLLYGVSAATLGSLGPVLGWPVFMSLIVITASLLGMMTGEWKHGGRIPIAIQWSGVGLLVLAVFVLANASRQFS